MNAVIYKYILNIDRKTIDMPTGAHILKVARQGDCICVWARVYPNQMPHTYRFLIVATGEHRDDFRTSEYLDTVFFEESGLVFHIYLAVE